MSDFKLQMGLLKFEDLREAIKKYFRELRGFDYSDANNFSIIVDTLAYLQENMAYQLSATANNLFLRSCNDRRLLVEIAYAIGYTPLRKTPNRINLTNLTSKTYSQLNSSNDFLSIGNKTNLQYRIKYDMPAIGGTSTTGYAIQEIPKTYNIMGTGLQNQKIQLPTMNISTSNIIISVGDNVWEKYNLLESIPDYTSQIYYIQESKENEFYTEIEFGNGIIGSMPSSNDLISISYYETSGTVGNDEIKIDCTGVTNSTTTYEQTYSGRDFEDSNSIKINAPKYFNSKQRLITKNDYENYLGNISGGIVNVKDDNSALNSYTVGNINASIVPSIGTLIANYNDLTEELIKPLTSTTLYDYKLLNWYNEIDFNKSYISTLTVSDTNTYTDLDTKKIVSTELNLSSCNYMYIDITPTVENKYKGLSLDSLHNKYYRNQLYKYLADNNQGFNSDFREDDITKYLLDLDSQIKSVDFLIDYAMIFNKNNILDSYTIELPTSFISSNDDYRIIDNTFLGYNYSLSNMPNNRKSIFSELNSKTYTINGNNLIFNRELYNSVADTSLTKKQLAVEINSEGFNFIKPAKINGRSIQFTYDNITGIVSGVSNSKSYPIGTLSTITMNNYTYYSFVPNNINDFAGIDLTLNLLDWLNIFTFDCTKESGTNQKLKFQLYVNSSISSTLDSNLEYIKLDSYSELGSITYDINTNKIKSQIKLFNTKVETDGSITLKYSDYTCATIKYINGMFVVNNIDYSTIKVNDLPFIKQLYIKDNKVYATEFKIDSTILGYFYKQEARISLDNLIGKKNNIDISDVYSLENYITDNQLLLSGNYKIELKPKFNIIDNMIIYTHDYNKKDGIYQLFNVNTLR